MKIAIFWNVLLRTSFNRISSYELKHFKIQKVHHTKRFFKNNFWTIYRAAYTYGNFVKLIGEKIEKNKNTNVGAEYVFFAPFGIQKRARASSSEHDSHGCIKNHTADRAPSVSLDRLTVYPVGRRGTITRVSPRWSF